MDMNAAPMVVISSPVSFAYALMSAMPCPAVRADSRPVETCSSPFFTGSITVGTVLNAIHAATIAVTAP